MSFLDKKPHYQKTYPESFDINISDRSGLKTFLFAIFGIVSLLIALHFLIKTIAFFSPYFISVDLENKIFQNTHTYFFRSAIFSKELTGFSKKLDSSNTNLEVYIINMDIPNAFCFLGNKLFVTTELLKTAESENELAFVLAHELGHAHHRHNLKNLSSNVALSFILSFMNLLEPAANLLSLGYSRTMEVEADAFAILTIKKIYGHTFGTESFFTRLQAQEKTHSSTKLIGGYFSSHPDMNLRIQRIKATQKKGIKQNLISREDSKLFQTLSSAPN